MSESKSRGIDWMYQGAASKAELKKNEEESYLLGKEYNPKSVKSGDLAVGQQASVGMSRVVEGVDGIHHNMPDKNEAFLLKHEDPMFMVNQTRKEKERDRRKKKELFDKASVNYGNSSGRSRKGSSHRSRRDRRDRSMSQSSSEDERRRRKRKKDKKRKKKRHRSNSTDSEDSKYRRRRSRKRDRKDRYRDKEDDSGSRSPSPHSESMRRKKHRKRERSESNDRHERKSKPEENLNDEKNKVVSSKPDDRKSYGLIGSKGPKKEITRGSLGPDSELLAKKQQEREEARNRYKRRDRNSRSKMTDEERSAALSAMQNDGNNRAELLAKASTAEKVDLHDEEIQRRMKEGSKDVSAFVQDLVVKTHGIDGDNAPSLAKQLQQNRNYIQRASDDNFL